ncbi:hypothetical protein QJS04_geneDACA022540 [Acorus gramineus]|uniref:Uncharacterized protein n=1 Tax=Acorus gramineus TaxID=55184 RepID=A0AAV9A8C9_ACOGR|nr:hypothetical protein QJS04_geneDACA022540 [Acorus gramineus]
MSTAFLSLKELGEAGKELKWGEEDAVTAMISHTIVPTGVWTIWRTRNEKIFRGARVYQENM